MSISKTIYDHSPIWMQNLLVSLQGAVLNRRRWDVALGAKLLAELRESQHWSAKKFLTYRNERLSEHIRYAATTVPYYRELFKREGIDARDISSVEDLRRLPLLEKREIRAHPLAFLRGGRIGRSWNHLFTSGTTGSPMELFSSRESFTRVWAFVFRLREWAGLSDPVFPRRAQFTGRDIVPDRRIGPATVFWRHNLAGNAVLLSTSHLSQETVLSYAEALFRFEPELIDGYPSAISIVARVALSRRLPLPRPKAIITSAETLLPDDRESMEEAFGCTVFNQYASSDTAAFISQCEKGSLHINPEFGICEILRPDGTPAAPGEEGEIVATSFCNREQVFIRYRIGDTAVVGPDGICPCGREMPRVTAVTGRLDDTLFIPDRGFVGRLDPVFKSLHGIIEAQIVQESLDAIRVLLVPAPTNDPASEEAFLLNLRKKVGYTIHIEIEKVSAIPRGPNGKFRSVVSLCRDAYPTC